MTRSSAGTGPGRAARPNGVLVLLSLLALSGCTVVGYPAGEAPAGAAPSPAAASAPGGSGDADGVQPRSRRDRPDFRLDGPPADPGAVDLGAIPDASPVQEPLARSGNAPRYEVFGETYRTLATSEGYEAEGVASWYGREFHGRSTSSGEPYDMYAMSAAHRTLPLPTYLEVTNLDNGRRVVVRVNDRGPFHDDRILDLSYAAAWKLRMLGTGTARVRIRALEPAAR